MLSFKLYQKLLTSCPCIIFYGENTEVKITFLQVSLHEKNGHWNTLILSEFSKYLACVSVEVQH